MHDAFTIRILDRRNLVSTLEGAHSILFIAGDRDDASAPRHLDDIVAMMSCNHELGQVRIPKDGVVRGANVGHVEVDELIAVVFALAEGDREADLPYRDGGVVGHS